MSRIKGRDTKPELRVRRTLHALSYRFRLHCNDLPGKPDIVFRGRRKIIFVHGCFFHMHACKFGKVEPQTNADFWRSKREKTVARDAHNLSVLRATGWDVLVVWECETKSADLPDLLTQFLN